MTTFNVNWLCKRVFHFINVVYICFCSYQQAVENVKEVEKLLSPCKEIQFYRQKEGYFPMMVKTNEHMDKVNASNPNWTRDI